MQWTKATIKTTTHGVEIVTSLLIDLGIYSVEIIDPQEMEEFLAKGSPYWDYVDEELLAAKDKNQDVLVIFYTGLDEESANLVHKVKDKLLAHSQNHQHLGTLSLETTIADDQDWINQWKQYFKPISIGRLLVVPEWDKAQHTSEIILTIDPGQAFGTGQHATTKLCIEALQKWLQPNANIMDIGCGSGILSIASLLLGAQNVVACDIDPAASAITKKNASLNPVNLQALTVYTGNILEDNDLQQNLLQHTTHAGGYDIVIANIVADVIIQLSAFVTSFLKPGGLFIASGIISERMADVEQALISYRLNIIESITSDGWCCVVAK